MPQVPLYNSPQIAEQGLRTPQASAPDVSAGTRALGKAFGDVGEAAFRMADRDAEAEANKIDTEVTAGWLAWDAQARKQYQGQNVDEYQAKAAEWWDKARKDKGETISPLARERVGTALGRKYNQAMASVLGYVGSEKERFADQQSEAAAQTTIDFALDTGDTAGASERVRQLVAEKGARKGWTTELVQDDQQRLLGRLHLSYISQLAETDATKARQYYDANKTEIPGAARARARVEQVLKGEGDNQFATQFAAQQSGKPLSEQLQAAGEITDPQRREKTIQQVRNNHALVEQAKREQEGAASDQAWQMVGKGQRVPESVLMQMDGHGRVQLQDYLRERAKQAAAGTQPKTDWVLYLETRDKLAAGENVDLRPLATRIAGPQLEQLVDIKTKRNPSGKTPEVATSEQQISTYLNRLRIKDEDKGQFVSQAYAEFNDVLKRTGKEPGFDDRQAILDKLTTEVVTDRGMLWDTKKEGYKLTPAERAKAGFSAQPDAQSSTDKFTVGKVYKDGAGNRAKYLGGGKWETVK